MRNQSDPADAPDPYPIPLETLLASIADTLKESGNARELAILVNGQVKYDYLEEDFQVDFWALKISVDVKFYSMLKQDGSIKQAQDTICSAGATFFQTFDSCCLRRVDVVPVAAPNELWREQANEYLAGKGITNQGRVRSDNPASRTEDGLLFRSQPEINLYLALKAAGVTFAPLPVFLRGGRSYKRFEPDFVIVKGGLMTVVEVDGDTYHRELPADAQERLQPLEDEGAAVKRVKASECDTLEKAKLCAVKVLEFIDKRINIRPR